MSDCVEVTPQCPVSASTYGYEPSQGASLAFLAVFGLCTILQLIQGLRYRTYTWMLALVCGTALEVAGYVGRFLMRSNVFDNNYFLLQLVAIIIAPSFLVGALDLVPKHLAQTFGPEVSPLRPALYVWIFVSIDILGLLLQAVGGILASSGSGPSGNKALLESGNHLLVAGIAVQIFQLLALGTATAVLCIRLAKAARREGKAFALEILDAVGQRGWSRSAFKAFMIASIASYIAILARCIYRLPEMAGGWGGRLQREETTFYVLDGAMIALAAVLLSIFHPGRCFPALATSAGPIFRSNRIKSVDNVVP
ncbi:unnamed protein product [Sympodiomycopsis kandeliae]